MDIHYTLPELPVLASKLLAEYGRDTVYALEGELGTGKTTLVAELCRQLGVTEPVSSPTYSIVNTYASPAGPVYHLDCYRLQDVAEAVDAGLEELLDAPTANGAAAVFIEWPAVIQPLLPPDVVFLRLYHLATEEQRRIHVTTS
ncbi:tRNA threonylcarbamoyladenosine biosynthesis protein TsaE [Neolewinella maritima]|uniref:tRNA threonylcarbamoyladenosine biosynthesis protein TsaE n=1 Tax=Neolewinella maritima TaxID=1383882 RepID=A0ABN8F874_9BACT|nr:tRNA (adenosine(37)-N6)-threonylcarbamoyltransferase complex ATPase subunit type 1 TsaE [Neolewinella maritima]CAH1001425.1 tRNA threonylcarbamoyladenosine biosynthesis protein TsaE [Neolewinella maritima]